MVKELEQHLETTLYVGLELDFNKRPSRKVEDMVLKALHSTLMLCKHAGWICDYDMKGGKV